MRFKEAVPIKEGMQRLAFHPLVVLGSALTSAAIFAFFSYLLFEDEFRWFLLSYITPIGIPFVCFLFDRAARYDATPRQSWIVDGLALLLSLLRMVVSVPLISGHALFLTYALLTCRLQVARFSAALVLLQVTYLKVFVWHDITLFGGMLLGVVFAWRYRRAWQGVQLTQPS